MGLRQHWSITCTLKLNTVILFFYRLFCPLFHLPKLSLQAFREKKWKSTLSPIRSFCSAKSRSLLTRTTFVPVTLLRREAPVSVLMRFSKDCSSLLILLCSWFHLFRFTHTSNWKSLFRHEREVTKLCDWVLVVVKSHHHIHLSSPNIIGW